ncbi:DUF4867 family protein [Faecalispora anaeroviscerum]|uniref:DUF4867 family protein n=1 Tax=Faecalispora anaeroviscerum TaxID=2991836 RepID=UPI0024BA0989|nr:DUF4867 family protein [Faecalispora anaeroviscerum]
MFTDLVRKNPTLPLYPVTDKSFLQYGRVVEEYDFTPWLETMKQIGVPEQGNVYIADDPRLSSTELAAAVKERLNGSMPIEVGYCNGNGSQLNALEYHKMPELDLAVTDLVLLLADARDIRDKKLDTALVQGYYVPAGTACELYGTTLHFAPCKVSDEGFQCVVVLPQGVNLPLENLPKDAAGEERLLWMQGKWLIAHPESALAKSGAYAGLVGENIQVIY